MNKQRPLVFVLSFTCTTLAATDYIVDFIRIDDFETIRPLVERCTDFGAVELYRDRMESVCEPRGN